MSRPKQLCLTLVCVWCLAPPALAGGAVMLADETCIVIAGFYDIHFTAYQPRTRGDEGYCTELPDTGETVIVLDYLHDSLKEVPVTLRIVRNATDLGRFVQLEDVEALDLERHTVFHRPAAVEPGGSYQVTHFIESPGEYIAIITAGHPTKNKTYTAIVPFSAGVGGFSWIWALAAAVAATAAGLGVFWLRSRAGEAARAAD